MPSVTPRIRCVFAVILILIGFILFGLTRRAFAACTSSYTLPPPPSGWSFDTRQFSSQSSAESFCNSLDGAHYYCPTPLPFCTLNPEYYACLVSVFAENVQYVAYVCVVGGDSNCPDERAALETECGDIGYTIIDEETCDGRCNDCTQEAQEQCGDAEIIWNDDGDCSYQCAPNCAEERAALELECGGSDLYSINEDTCVGQCNLIDCSSAEWALRQMCGGDSYYIDPWTCDGYCTGDGCEYQAESECGSLQNVEWEDVEKCLFDCTEATKHCKDKAKQECVDEENIEWIDKENCQYKCISKCTDRDKDGVADACDYCPQNPEISSQVKVIYRLNGDADVCGTGYMTCDGRLVRSSDPGDIYKGQDTICRPAESVVVPCNMTEDCQKDTDGDGIPDGADDDDDGDGIPDSEDKDDDGDGTSDNQEDTDGDGIPDPVDTDDDGDGRPDKTDPDGDPDGDGKDNENDDDDDGDGIPDEKDPDQADCDQDGTVDSEDPDDDDDGILDAYDTQRNCKEQPKDTDGDGTPDSSDTDDDGDGIPDVDDPDTPGTDPPTEEPPPPDGGTDHGDIKIGDCKIDISTLRSIVDADSGKFPFNWMYAFANAFQPFVDVGGSPAPEFSYTFSFFGQEKKVDLHLERFDGIASTFRFFSALLTIFYFIQFVIKLYNKIITGG